MAGYITRRVIVLVVTLFVVSILSFIVPYLGGDPARAIVRSRINDLAVDPAAVEAVRQQFRLDDPIWLQYGAWLQSALVGDFGRSFTNNQPVWDVVVKSLGVSVLLATAALLIAVVIAVPLGIYAALRAGSRRDTAVLLGTQGLVALPEYWLAPLMMLLFVQVLGVLPAAGWTSPAHVLMPATVLALRPLAYLLGVTRASMMNVLPAPYITAARARGLSQSATLRRHAFKNSMVPVMTMFSIWLAGTIGGSVIVEVIFAIPGLGRLMYEAVINADIPVIQAGVIATVTLAILINMATDIGYAVLNPAVVVGESRG